MLSEGGTVVKIEGKKALIRFQMDTLWALDKNKGVSRIANLLYLFGGPKGIRTPVTDVRGGIYFL